MPTEPLAQTRFTTRLSIIVAMSLVVFAVYIIPTLTAFAGYRPSLGQRLFVSRILIWAATGAVWLYSRRGERLPFIGWRDVPLKPLRFISSVFLLLAIIYFGTVILTMILKLLNLLQSSEVAASLTKTSFLLRLMAVVTAAVTEELIFRGYLMPRLQLISRRPMYPIFFSALLFGLLHIGYGTIVNTLIPFFIGLVFGYYYQYYRNLKVLIVCHFLIDAISLLLLNR